MQAIRRTVVLLAILGMTLRGLLPAGWMPNPEGMSQTALIICDMDDSSMSAMDMPGMDMSHAGSGDAPTHKHADDGHQQPCPFAAAPHFATPHGDAILLLPSLAADFMHPLRQERMRVAGDGYKPQSPRAPPYLA
jgi:hypothetical protein